MYKGEHTEPEGDISYKTTTVAVKTLKGGVTMEDSLARVVLSCDTVQVSLTTVK